MPPSTASHIGALEFVTASGRRYARFPRLAALNGFAHAFSTRPEDVSARMDDRAPQRAARRALMAADLGFRAERLIHTVQIHEPRIAHVDEGSPAGAREGFDGLFTAAPGIPLMTFSADCPLILVVDPRRRAVGMVHSSWRCTLANAVPILIEQMRARLGCRPEELLAGVGPSAGPTEYEVGADVYEAAAVLDAIAANEHVRAASDADANRGLPSSATHPVRPRDQFFPRLRDGRMTCDLWAANRAQLIASGVRAENIEVAAVCTMTHPDVFYSFRREGAGCGHFGLMAGLIDA